VTDDSGIPDKLDIEVTEESFRIARERMARSELGHCFRCLSQKPSDSVDKDWGVLSWEDAPDGTTFLAVCPDCHQAVEDWLCGESDEMLGDPPPQGC
jgi:hypothetical protein